MRFQRYVAVTSTQTMNPSEDAQTVEPWNVQPRPASTTPTISTAVPPASPSRPKLRERLERPPGVRPTEHQRQLVADPLAAHVRDKARARLRCLRGGGIQRDTQYKLSATLQTTANFYNGQGQPVSDINCFWSYNAGADGPLADTPLTYRPG